MEIIRSLLFVPADSQKKIEKARSLRPDGLMLDLEDGVAPGNKLLARTVLSSELERLVEVPTKILVRVNGFQTQLLQDDPRIAVVDGRMVDRPIVLQAKRILQHKEDRL